MLFSSLRSSFQKQTFVSASERPKAVVLVRTCLVRIPSRSESHWRGKQREGNRGSSMPTSVLRSLLPRRVGRSPLRRKTLRMDPTAGSGSCAEAGRMRAAGCVGPSGPPPHLPPRRQTGCARWPRSRKRHQIISKVRVPHTEDTCTVLVITCTGSPRARCNIMPV